MAPQPAARAGAGSSSDYTILSLGVIVLGLGFGGWVLWQEQHGAVSAIAMNIMHGEMRLAHQFTSRYDVADAQVLAANPHKVAFLQLVHLAREIGWFFLAPAVAVVLILAALCFRRAAPTRFCRNLDLDGLMREQAPFFRGTAPFAARRLRLSGVAEGEPRPADPALNAREWIDRYATVNGHFEEIKAREELYRQLGKVWSAPAEADPHVRCLLAAFALHGAKKRSEALALLGDLAESLRPAAKEGREGPPRPLSFPKALVDVADRWLREADLMQPVVKAMARHGFTTPALMSALTEARLQAGVLAPAQFGFLKLVDRRLWYALHSLGFPSGGPGGQVDPQPRVEAIGARDHWASECVAGEPLVNPAIDRAINAIGALARGDALQVK
jgi:intracellular multiplication protein IcmP